jgi:hypothetical protein
MHDWTVEAAQAGEAMSSEAGTREETFREVATSWGLDDSEQRDARATFAAPCSSVHRLQGNDCYRAGGHSRDPARGLFAGRRSMSLETFWRDERLAENVVLAREDSGPSGHARVRRSHRR